MTECIICTCFPRDICVFIHPLISNPPIICLFLCKFIERRDNSQEEKLESINAVSSTVLHDCVGRGIRSRGPSIFLMDFPIGYCSEEILPSEIPALAHIMSFQSFLFCDVIGPLLGASPSNNNNNIRRSYTKQQQQAAPHSH